MRQIRLGVFETNSSSSHSVNIKVREKEEVIKNILRNQSAIYVIREYVCCNGNGESSITNILMSEVSKAAFMVNVIGRHLEILNDNGFVNMHDNFSRLCGGKDIDLRNCKEVISAIENDLIYTTWVKDTIYEETGTKVRFHLNEDHKYFPYISTSYYNDRELDSEENFYDELLEALKDNDEFKFKSLCREIIFNKEIIIEDVDEAYGNEINRNLL